jgi:hypothetical protein
MCNMKPGSMKMRNAVLAALTSALFVCGSLGNAAALVCPVPSAGATEAQAKEIAAAIPAGDALGDGAKLGAAISALRGKGIGNAILVDGLIAAYCPSVARLSGMTDEQKRAQVRRFAARTVRAVYAFDSTEAVILDVPLAPIVAAAVNAMAAAEKVTPEAWIANAVGRALK